MSFQSEEYRRNMSLDRCSTASVELFVPLIVLKISQVQALIKNKGRETRKYFPTKQISQEKIDHLIIVIPTWKTQLWYSQLLEISVQPPFRLPQIRNLLANPRGKNHLLVETRSLRLAVWQVSRKVCKWKEFQGMLSSLSHIQRETAQQLTTNWTGLSELAGVMRDKLLFFKHL